MNNFEKLIFDDAPIGLAYCENRHIVRCNQFFAEMFTTSIKRLQESSLKDLYPSSKESQQIGQRALNGLTINGAYNDERIMRRINGELFWCRVRGTTLQQVKPFAQTIWSFSDLSEERPIIKLKFRERQVAMLLCQGKTTKEISEELYLSPRTIEVYRARLLEAYSVKNTVELVKCLVGF